MIAYLGTGLLGSAFVRALLARGETVHVWNRSSDKAKSLEQFGAVAFANAADAVRDAERVHLTLSDDAAVNGVLAQIQASVPSRAPIVDHTTTAPEPTGERVRRMAEQGIAFLHAPVFMGPPNAIAATGVMLASGDRAQFDTVSAHLEKMTGKLVYLGADPSRAAAMKLLGNHFIIAVTTGLMDTLGLAKAMSVPQDQVTELLTFFNPGAMAEARLARVRAADYSNPSWNLGMARKDVRLMQAEAAAGDMPMMLLPGVASLMDEEIAKGRVADDWTVIASRVLE
ncbi:MAG: NAD(P)-binding domain-containing protein [Gemmatimonadota bacterium]|nr:NAD(P)-binding domain-containing protein [Gemmatimonadota bacterium]